MAAGWKPGSEPAARIEKVVCEYTRNLSVGCIAYAPPFPEPRCVLWLADTTHTRTHSSRALSAQPRARTACARVLHSHLAQQECVRTSSATGDRRLSSGIWARGLESDPLRRNVAYFPPNRVQPPPALHREPPLRGVGEKTTPGSYPAWPAAGNAYNNNHCARRRSKLSLPHW